MLIFHVRLSFLLPNLLLYRLCVLYLFYGLFQPEADSKNVENRLLSSQNYVWRCWKWLAFRLAYKKYIFVLALFTDYSCRVEIDNIPHSLYLCAFFPQIGIARVVFQSKQSIWHGPTQHPTTQKFEINASSVIKCTRKSETLNESANNRMKQKRNDTFFRW